MQNVILDTAHKKFGLFLLFIYLLQEYGKPVWLNIPRFMVMVEILLVIYILLNMKNVVLFLKDKVYVLYILMLLQMTYHVPTAANNYWAFWGWVLMCTNLIFMIAISLSLQHEKYAVLFINMYLLVHGIVAVDHLLYGKMHFGSSGILNDSNDLAAGMIFVIPISFFLGLSFAGFRRYVYFGATFLFVSVAISSLSRGGFLGLAFVILYSLYKLKNRFAAIMCLILVAIAFIYFSPENYKNELFSIAEEGYGEKGTGRERIELWKIAWRTFLDYPIMGVGQGNLPWIWGEYQDPEIDFFLRGVGGRTVHSIYFLVLPELGIVGITLFGLIIYYIFKKYMNMQNILRSDKQYLKEKFFTLSNLSTGLFIGLTGYLICGIFLSTFYYPQIWSVAGMFVGLDLLVRNHEIGITNKLPKLSPASTN